MRYTKDLLLKSSQFKEIDEYLEKNKENKVLKFVPFYDRKSVQNIARNIMGMLGNPSTILKDERNYGVNFENFKDIVVNTDLFNTVYLTNLHYYRDTRLLFAFLLKDLFGCDLFKEVEGVFRESANVKVSIMFFMLDAHYHNLIDLSQKPNTLLKMLKICSLSKEKPLGESFSYILNYMDKTPFIKESLLKNSKDDLIQCIQRFEINQGSFNRYIYSNLQKNKQFIEDFFGENDLPKKIKTLFKNESELKIEEKIIPLNVFYKNNKEILKANNDRIRSIELSSEEKTIFKKSDEEFKVVSFLFDTSSYANNKKIDSVELKKLFRITGNNVLEIQKHINFKNFLFLEKHNEAHFYFLFDKDKDLNEFKIIMEAVIQLTIELLPQSKDLHKTNYLEKRKIMNEKIMKSINYLILDNKLNKKEDIGIENKINSVIKI